jgi:hypothetical protein
MFWVNHVQKTNFSTGVKRYTLRVTSSWYCFRCSHRLKEVIKDMMARARPAGEGRWMFPRVDTGAMFAARMSLVASRPPSQEIFDIGWVISANRVSSRVPSLGCFVRKGAWN